MEVSKIHLSSSEIELVQNAAIILTKNKILDKMKGLLEEVQQKQIALIEENDLKNEIFKIPPKISKGEYYLGLPYFILDHPRQSSETNFFFIRTMFWWGNFFSCTLHVAGNSKDHFKERIKQSYDQIEDYFIGINDDPWIHHLEENNYRSISSMSKKEFEESCEKFDHLKIAGKYPLSEWEKISSILFENWKLYLRICGLIS